MTDTGGRLGRLIRNRSHGAARGFAIVDQGLQGAASLLTGAILARALPSGDFGSVGVMVGLYYFVFGFHRCAIVLPYITERDHPDRAGSRYHADWWWLSLFAALAIAAVLALLAGLARLVTRLRPEWGWIVEPFALAALITPPLLAAEHLRRWLYQVQQPGFIVLVSGAFFVAMLGTAVVVAHAHPTAVFGALAWAAAGLAGAVVGLAVLRPAGPRLGASIDCLRRNRAFAGLQSLTHLPYAVYSNATVVVPIGMLLGPQAAAVFTAARTITNPAISLVSAVDSTDKPRAARAMAEAGVPGLLHSIGRTRVLLLLLTGGYLALIALFAGPVLDFAFHGRYAGNENVVRLLALAFFLMCLNQPSETLLVVLRASGIMLATRTLAAVATLLALWLGMSHGVPGMAVAVVVAQAIAMAALLVAERVAARRAARDSGAGERPIATAPTEDALV